MATDGNSPENAEYVRRQFAGIEKIIGRFFGMNSETAAFFIDDFVVQYVGYKLSDPDKAEEIKANIESELTGDITISIYSGE